MECGPGGLMSALYIIPQVECSEHYLARVHGPTWGGGIAWSDRRLLREWDSDRFESAHQLLVRVDGYFHFYVTMVQSEMVLYDRSRSRHQQKTSKVSQKSRNLYGNSGRKIKFEIYLKNSKQLSWNLRKQW